MYIHINGIIKHGLLMRAVCFPYLLRWLSQRCLTTILRTGTFQPCLTTPEVLKGDMYHNGSWIIMDHNGSLSCIIYIYIWFNCLFVIWGSLVPPMNRCSWALPSSQNAAPVCPGWCSKAPGIGMPKIETPVSRIYAKEVEEMVRRSAVVHIDQEAASLDLASWIHFFSFFGWSFWPPTWILGSLASQPLAHEKVKAFSSNKLS